MKVVLPLPPSVNSMYSQSRSGHRFKTAEAKAWEFEASFKIKKLKKLGKKRVEVAYDFYFKDDRSDIAPREKILTDMLEKCQVIDNDRQVDVMHLCKYFDKVNPRVEVELWVIE